MLFPSLGPSAFVLATFPESEVSNARRVVLAHGFGVLAGYITYHGLAYGVVITGPIAPFSPEGLRLVLSGIGAIVLTVGAMLFFEVRHPPACATTLIVALGLLPTFTQGVLIMIAVVVLLVVQSLIVSREGLKEKVGEVAGSLGDHYRRRVD